MPTALEPLSGQERFARPPSRVFAVLSDPEALAGAMPGIVSSEPADGRARRCVVRPTFSFVSGSIRVLLTVEEAAPEERIRVRAAVQGIGLSMEILSHMRISPAPEGSEVAWDAQVIAIKGLLSAVPGGLIRAAAESVVREGWRALRQRIEAEPA
jgi:carbon monoxide dehydrogenase subunit G